MTAASPPSIAAHPLFSAFEPLADAPGSVTKLRELILQLAVQGRLVPRNKDDQEDEAWCDFIDQFDSRIYGSDPGPPPPFEIPDEWRWVSLDDVADYRTAKKVEPSAIPDSAWVLDLEEVEKNSGRVVEFKTFADKRSTSTKAAFEPGDVLFGKLRPYLNKVVVAPKAGFCTTEIVPIRSRGVIRPDYLGLFLRSPQFVRYTTGKSYGMKMPRLGTDDAESADIALPPPGEQARIVAKVDELMALCDELETRQTVRASSRKRFHAATLQQILAARSPGETSAHWRRLHTHFDTLHAAPDSIPALRQAILQLAIQGRLVPQDTNDESASALLKRVAPAGDEAVREEENSDLPQGWLSARFDAVASVTGGVTLGRKLGERKTVEMPYLRVANVKRGEIDLTIIKRVAIPEDEQDRYLLREGDLLMTEGGDWDKVGRAAIWRGELPLCLHQNHVFRARMRSEELNPVWFEMYFNSPPGRRYFEAASKQTTNLASINMRQVRSCPVPLPPVAEQKRIIAKVQQLMVLCDELEAKLAYTDARRERLLAAAIHKMVAA